MICVLLNEIICVCFCYSQRPVNRMKNAINIMRYAFHVSIQLYNVQCSRQVNIIRIVAPRSLSRSMMSPMGAFDYGSSDHLGHLDFKLNTRSRIDKFRYRVQNDCTPMLHLLAGDIGRNGVTCALVPVVRVQIT